jgi:hypothetical protein
MERGGDQQETTRDKERESCDGGVFNPHQTGNFVHYRNPIALSKT